MTRRRRHRRGAEAQRNRADALGLGRARPMESFDRARTPGAIAPPLPARASDLRALVERAPSQTIEPSRCRDPTEPSLEHRQCWTGSASQRHQTASVAPSAGAASTKRNRSRTGIEGTAETWTLEFVPVIRAVLFGPQTRCPRQESNLRHTV